MRTAAAIVSLVLLTLALIFAGRERANARRAESQLADLRSARATLDASIRHQGFRGAAKEGSSVSVSTGAGRGETAADSRQSPSAARDAATLVKTNLRSSYLKAYRDSLDAILALLFARLHLTPAQEDGLKELLAQREANNLKLDDLTKAAGLEDSSEDPTLNALDDQLSEANKAAIEALIGHRGKRTVNAFLKEKNVLPALDMIGGDSAAADLPLSPDQSELMFDVLVAASQKTSSGRVVKDTVDWDQVQARAPAVLSPAQVGILQGVRADAEARDRVRRMVVALNGAAAGVGP